MSSLVEMQQALVASQVSKAGKKGKISFGAAANNPEEEARQRAKADAKLQEEFAQHAPEQPKRRGGGGGRGRLVAAAALGTGALGAAAYYHHKRKGKKGSGTKDGVKKSLSELQREVLEGGS